MVVTDGLENIALARIATKLRKNDPKPVVGWALVRPSDCDDHSDTQMLSFKIDYTPIPRHGNLRGWPSDDEKRLATSHQLALQASGVRYPPAD